jgi:Na+-translocating ferredoxin:NAD+ oxidoreductase RnfD subunit
MNSNTISLRTKRLGGLRRFAIAITVFNILGHTVFGFEQSLAQPLAALATAYSMEIILELIDAWANRRSPNFLGGGVKKLVQCLLSAHITALAVAMLTYANDRIWVVVFTTVVAMASKVLLRAPTEEGSRHFLNPSNFGISVVLLVFPWVGVAPPYHFTENLYGVGDWILPGIIFASGTFVNARFTGRLPLIASWLGGFFLQAFIRSLIFGTPLVAGLLPMTGLAFILYTFYMVTDPATTPESKRAQIAFGASVAAVYGLLVVTHVVFGLFFALTIVCIARGLGLYVLAFLASKSPARLSAQAATASRQIQ